MCYTIEFMRLDRLRTFVLLRKHVNIFSDSMIHDRQGLLDPVSDCERVFIFQALQKPLSTLIGFLEN